MRELSSHTNSASWAKTERVDEMAAVALDPSGGEAQAFTAGEGRVSGALTALLTFEANAPHTAVARRWRLVSGGARLRAGRGSTHGSPGGSLIERAHSAHGAVAPSEAWDLDLEVPWAGFDGAAPVSTARSRKLHPPQPPVHPVERAHITRDLSLLQRARLVVIRAPAGFGKTAVMLQIRDALERTGTRTAWLTLDDLDNDPTSLLACVTAASARLLCADVFTVPPSGRADARSTATMPLFDRLAEGGPPFAVFLDDFEKLDDPGALAIVGTIIDSLPAHGQLVIASRAIPHLALGRLRALGQLAELGPDQMRFSPEETHEYLVTKRGLELDGIDVARLHRVTEGWPAALSLVSIALTQRSHPRTFVADFSGSNSALGDYLIEDVLGGLADPLRLFLLETSVLSELSAPLCDFVRARTDSEAFLAELERMQLFLVPLDDERRAYRYHRLFAEFLRAQLRRAHPERVAALNQGASRWYVDQQRPIAATEHALAGGDVAGAIALLSVYGRTILRSGRARLLSRWLRGIDAGLLAEHPDLRITQLWALFFSQEPQEALTKLDAMELEPVNERRYAATASDLLAIRPLLLLRMDRFEEAYDIGVRNAATLAGSRAFSFGILGNSIATMQVVEGAENDARRWLAEASQTDVDGGGDVGTLFAACSAGAVDLLQGRLRQATAHFDVAERSLTQPRVVPDVGGNAVAAVFRAVAAYEVNDLEGAERRLAVYLPILDLQGFPDQIIMGSLVHARIAFHGGDIARAWKQLTELEYRARNAHWPRAIATARLERSHLLLLRGDVGAAKQELEGASVPGLWERVERFSMPANDLHTLSTARSRLMIHAGEAHAAIQALRAVLEGAARAQRYRRVVHTRILLALALRAVGKRGGAFAEIHEALRDASREGFVRVFVDEGNLAAALIQELAEAPSASAVGRSTREHIDTLLAAFGRAPEGSSPLSARSGARVKEALTRAELQVIKLLSSEGLSNDAMAKRLFVSETTVRTHLRNINSKLGAGSRTQAVSIARRLGLTF